MKDFLIIKSYEAQEVSLGVYPTSSFVAKNTNHLFKENRTSLNSTLKINLTDYFGQVITDSMKRPKEFPYLMK